MDKKTGAEYTLEDGPMPPVTTENSSSERVQSWMGNEHEPALWVWQYSNGVFSSTTFKTRKACEMSTLPNVPGQPVALYLRPLTPHMPEPMTDNELEEICWTEIDRRLLSFARSIESETLRRVKEINK